jgi:hypothetical protein
MMKLIASLLFLVVAAQVEAKGNGEIQVLENLPYKRLFSQRVLVPGTYQGDMEILSTKIKLKITDNVGKKHKIKIKFKIDSLPSRSGEFTLFSSQLKQPFSVAGNMRKVDEQTSSNRHFQSCTIQVPVRVCTIDRDGRRICQIVYQNAYGQQLVMTTTITEFFILNINFTSADRSQNLASFTGRDSRSQTYTEFLGPCYLN